MLVGYDFLFDKFDQVMANFNQLFFDFALVLLKTVVKTIFFLRLPLHRLYYFQLSPPRRYNVFIGRGTKASLSRSQFLFALQYLVSICKHFLIPFGLLSQFGQQDIVLFFEILSLHIQVNKVIRQIANPLYVYILIIRYKAMNLVHTDKSVYQVAIELNIVSATTTIRFPSLFSVQWKTNNQKVNIETNKYSPQGAKTQFNQRLVMKTEVTYDKAKRCFLKKETQVQLNLTSKNRADQSKLVGRVTIDLATILNEGVYSQPTQFQLQFCSVNATLVMSFRTLQKVETDLSVSQLELSYGESLSLNSALKLATNTIAKQKNKESIEIVSDSESKGKLDFLQIFKKELISPLSPQSVDPVSKQASSLKQSITSINELRSAVQQKVAEIKPATRSFKNLSSAKESTQSKKSEVTEDFEAKVQDKRSAFKKLGSLNSDASDGGKLSEDFTKQKLDNQRLKQYEDEHIRLQKTRQQCQLVKLELKQKKTSLDQVSNQANIYKTQLAKMRDQVSKNREESVALNLKLAQLKESYNALLVKSSSSERELAKLESINQKYQLLRKENQGLVVKVKQYESENAELKNTLNNLDQMHQEALYKCNQHQEALVQNQDSFGMIKERLANEVNQKMSFKLQVEQLSGEVKRLQKMASQYKKTNSELAKQLEASQQENNNRKNRIEQLEEGIIELDNQIQFYSQENNTLIQNYNSTKEQLEAGEAQREQLKRVIKHQLEQLQQLRNQITNHKQQNSSIQKELSNMQQLCSHLQKDYNNAKTQNDSLNQENNQLKLDKQAQSLSLMQLQASYEELATKNNEMEELVLNINELREKQREEFTNKQNNFILTIADHEANTHQLTSMLQNNSEKIVLLEEQLKGRQALIVRLQQGLNGQVQRSEELSKKILHYMDKDQRMKETILLLEEEWRKVSELLVEQQLKQADSKQQIVGKEKQLEQLTFTYNQTIKHIQELQAVNIAKQSSLRQKISNLSREVQQKNEEIQQLAKIIDKRQLQIQQSTQKLCQTSNKLAQKIAANDILANQINQIEAQKSRTEDLLLIKQSAIESLQSEVSQKLKEMQTLRSSLQNQAIELNQFCQEMQQKQAKHEEEMKDIQDRFEQLSNKYQQAEHERVMRQEQQLESNNALQLEISELKMNCEALEKQITDFNINHYKDQLKNKNQEIRKLENQLKSANAEANKIPSLERALKIKSIELSSLKFKGKLDGSEDSQLLKLKDEQISSLRVERDALLEKQRDFQDLKEKSDALTTELQLLEEQKFNIQSLSNERALQLEQIRDENKKLLDQITIIGQRNGLLQKSLQDFIFNANANQNQSKYYGNSQFASICKSLLSIIDARSKSREAEKLAQVAKNNGKQYQEVNKNQKIKALSKQFQKLKIFILKNDAKSGTQQRAKLLVFFRDYQGLVNEIMKTTQN